jgi:hypothetical protein
MTRAMHGSRQLHYNIPYNTVQFAATHELIASMDLGIQNVTLVVAPALPADSSCSIWFDIYII